MKVRTLYFASLREALRCEEEAIDVPEGILSVGALREWLASRGEAWSEVLGPSRAVRAAVNHTMVDARQSLREGDEVAFFPPVTGG